MSAVEFRILGPLEVRAGPDRLELGGARQQVVLAVLLLNANHVVSVERLLEAVYGEELPPTARSQTQITISALRRRAPGARCGCGAVRRWPAWTASSCGRPRPGWMSSGSPSTRTGWRWSSAWGGTTS